jgi:hypothetical protein
MRPRNRLSADQWAARLNAEMERVLRNPDDFHPTVRWWAEWRRTWLAESGSRVHEPAERTEVAEGEGLAGPSCEPPPAGGLVAQFRLRLGSEKVVGCRPRGGSWVLPRGRRGRVKRIARPA